MGKVGAQGNNEKTQIFGAMLIAIISLFYLFSDTLYTYLLPFNILQSCWVQNIGIVILTSVSALFITAQFQMGNSWRLGINQSEKTALIKTGLFNISRNPIYLGLLISFLGYFLILPNFFSFCCLLIGFTGLNKKIKIEEQYLQKMHPEELSGYKKRCENKFEIVGYN